MAGLEELWKWGVYGARALLLHVHWGPCGRPPQHTALPNPFRLLDQASPSSL